MVPQSQSKLITLFRLLTADAVKLQPMGKGSMEHCAEGC